VKSDLPAAITPLAKIPFARKGGAVDQDELSPR